MGLEPKFTKADVERMMRERMDRIDRAIVFTLKYLGEQCVSIARENGDYNDITGNLRNSIGYVLVKHGEIIADNFKRSARPTSGKGKGSKNGVSIGREFAEELARDHTSGYALIVVAGMNYALYVERKYNRDVLNSSERFADAQLPGMLRDLKVKVAKMQ